MAVAKRIVKYSTSVTLANFVGVVGLVYGVLLLLDSGVGTGKEKETYTDFARRAGLRNRSDSACGASTSDSS
jgi:hypothetical protein